MVAALLRAGGRYTTGPGELVVRAQGETLRLWAAVGAAAPQDEEATPVDEMGTDELLEVLREHAPQLPAGSPFAEAWAAMDHLLTAGGIECLPAPWDGHALAPVASTDAEAARAANTAARFTAQDDADPDSHPYVTLGDGGDGEILVGTRIEDGRLDLFVDLDTMDAEGPFLRPEDGTMPIVLRVNGQVVYRA